MNPGWVPDYRKQGFEELHLLSDLSKTLAYHVPSTFPSTLKFTCVSHWKQLVVRVNLSYLEDRYESRAAARLRYSLNRHAVP